jgi:hypothetical protein
MALGLRQGERITPIAFTYVRGRVSAWLRGRLARPSVAYQIALIATILLMPTLWSGLLIDDLLHRLIAEGRLVVPGGRLDLFDLLPARPDLRASALEAGTSPWWTGPDTTVNYFRPLAALTHLVDYTLWPRAAWLMHLENLGWYAGLVLVSAALYRRFTRPGWVAGLATWLYALDHAHATPVAWIANRSAIMSALLGVLAVLAHDRWRRTRKHWFAPVAGLAFSLSLLSAEAGISIAGYLVAYALFVEQGPRSSRVLSLTPYVALALLWRVGYRALGHGLVDSGANCDPLANPAAFVIRALQSIPVFLASDVSAIPADGLLERCNGLAVAAVVGAGVVAIFGYAVWSLLRRNRTSRFLAAGAAMSALPIAGALPADRYLFWVGLGVMGLAAQLAGAVHGTGCASLGDYARRCICLACLAMRGVLSPLAFPVRTVGPCILHDEYERLAETLPVPGSSDDPAGQTVVLLNAPFDPMATFLPVMRIAKGLPVSPHQYLLYAGVDTITVRRVGARAIEVTSERGWTSADADRIYRLGPFRAGDTVNLSRMSAQVEKLTPDGRAATVRFSFADDLDDPSLTFLSWGCDGYERFVPPPVDAAVTMSPPALLLSGALKPHVRLRAVDP